MKKRTFLKAILATGGIAFTAKRQLGPGSSKGLVLSDVIAPPPATPSSVVPDLVESTPIEEFALGRQQEKELHPSYVHQEHHQLTDDIVEQLDDDAVDDYLKKIRNFDADFKTDIYLGESNSQLLLPTVQRLDRVQGFVGHANFNLLAFEEMIYFARNYEQIGAFEKTELDFLEEIYFADATSYGFYGEKVTTELNHRIQHKDVVKIQNSGHYLHRGESLKHYEQIRKDVGSDLLLTSGIRNNVKQMHLFLAKAVQANGNLSKASRSLAPPGHSFHNLGDFDVGKVGLGELNFTADFSHTEEFQRLIRLGYVDIRYTDSNQYGVRYEPWHIKLG